MLPNIDPRQMKQMMRQFGIRQEPIDAKQVIIRCEDKDIVLDSPEVVLVNMQGNKSFQISGDFHEEKKDSLPEINEDDVNTVKEATGLDSEICKEKLVENKGDIAKTIMDLKK